MISSHVSHLGCQSLSSFFVMFIIFLNFLTSSGEIDNYKECSLLASCGQVSNIGYPFWGDHLRPPDCGIRNNVFKLQCPTSNDSYDYPILHIQDRYDHQYHPPLYKVLGINLSMNTIKLEAEPRPYTNCSIPLHEPVFSGRPFEYTSNVEVIDLLECNQSIENYTSIACLNKQTKVTLWYYYVPPDIQIYNDSCKRIPVAVLKNKLEQMRNQSATLESVLKKGFELYYLNVYFRACVRCKHSGGTCGSSENQPFVCFCKNRKGTPYYSVCRESETARDIHYIAGFAGLFVLLTVIVCLCSCNFRSKKILSKIASYHRLTSDLEMGNLFFGIPLFSYTELQQATNNFDPDQILGDGAFGIVYYGKLRDGREVAVKRLYEKNFKRVGPFMNEVEILTRLSHPNLVTLHGCTSRHSRELLLVYEYIPNGTVADHLYGPKSQSRLLTWTIRMKIAIQTTEALSYLHTCDVIHRDVKTTNILLDSDFTVKVADFGLSRLFPFGATHLSTAPQGTPGYLDPEYHKSYQVTSKSDVYSFGVVLIELISSLPAIDVNRNGDEIHLSAYALNKIQHGKLAELVDQKLEFESDFKVKKMVTLVAELAFRCLQPEKDIRPSMEEVLESLKQIESTDYEALEAAEMKRGLEISNPASDAVEKTLSDAQNQSSSANSVAGSWVSKSTMSNSSG